MRVALLYDFDLTLTPKYMFDFGFATTFGYDSSWSMFRDFENRALDSEMDMVLSAMNGVVEVLRDHDIAPTREYLQGFGKDIEYFDGVTEWFDNINALGSSLGLEIEHYIISSGIREIIEGTTIAKHFKRIYASFYSYKNGVAFWPSQIVNYTNKTQYIFRIRKNALDQLNSLSAVNRKMEEWEELPFSNIIYFGDSETDIPAFKIIKNAGGMSICVFAPNDSRSQAIARSCFLDGRVNHYLSADYTLKGEIFATVREYLNKLAGNQINNKE